MSDKSTCKQVAERLKSMLHKLQKAYDLDDWHELHDELLKPARACMEANGKLVDIRKELSLLNDTRKIWKHALDEAKEQLNNAKTPEELDKASFGVRYYANTYNHVMQEMDKYAAEEAQYEQVLHQQMYILNSFVVDAAKQYEEAKQARRNVVEQAAQSAEMILDRKAAFALLKKLTDAVTKAEWMTQIAHSSANSSLYSC